MDTFTPNIFTRATVSNTWTEIAGATKGLAGGVIEAELDAVVVNWAESPATVLIALTSDDTPPASDDVAIRRVALAKDGLVPFSVVVTGNEHLWIKSDQPDARANVVGRKKESV